MGGPYRRCGHRPKEVTPSGWSLARRHDQNNPRPPLKGPKTRRTDLGKCQPGAPIDSGTTKMPDAAKASGTTPGEKYESSPCICAEELKSRRHSHPPCQGRKMGQPFAITAVHGRVRQCQTHQQSIRKTEEQTDRQLQAIVNSDTLCRWKTMYLRNIRARDAHAPRRARAVS